MSVFKKSAWVGKSMLLAGLAAIGLVIGGAAQADWKPDKPVRSIGPSGAGRSTDQRARARAGQHGRGGRDLGQAYAGTGQPGLASLASAERYALAGRADDARLHATRAADRLPRGSAPWQRAQDVLDATR